MNAPSAPNTLTLGWHWFVDFSGCRSMPTTPAQLRDTLCHAARLAGATIVAESFHEFSPHGLSGVVVIAESHFAVHTWPEHQAICIDLFSCSSRLNIDTAIAYLQEIFKPASTRVREVTRDVDSIAAD